MPGYDVILFDLDGTLTDPKPGITKSVAYALARFGIEVDDLDTLTPFIGPPLPESFQRYYGFDAEKARRAVDHYREYFAATGLYENAVYPGIPELLERLVARGKRPFVATTKPTIYAERILAHFGLTRHFERILGSNLDLSRSDKAAIIADVLDALPGVARESVVMVGDREHDIIGARGNRVDAIGVLYGYGTANEIRAAGPTYLAGSVAELGALLLG
jgi:phosphoglycolate phosphatase